ncbi:MAG: anaerobic sulfatase maturase [Bacteroidales bacterium]|nr:anaerobic sulfatase maturase [Bacteroidales bacterium]
MDKKSVSLPVLSDFQIFAKPIGPVCNLDCAYCYYLDKKNLWPESTFRMSDQVLETYLTQHIQACSDAVIFFSWHGGEPLMAGLNYFRKIVDLQKKLLPPGKTILNGIQTNGTLLDEIWCRFLKEEGFMVGLSLDGPKEFHDRFRTDKKGEPTHDKVLRAFRLLSDASIPCEVLCVVNSCNVMYPEKLYHFFKETGIKYLTFLPLVEYCPDLPGQVSQMSVPSDLFGSFLCTVFDEWKEKDIGQIKIQIFEETLRTAFGQEHSLCVFRPVCGRVPVIEHNGDFYSCDHFVDPEHRLGNIMDTHLAQMLESLAQSDFGKAKQGCLPACCLRCEVKDMCNGACPKDRFIRTSEGDPGLNYLCSGYKKFFTHCRPFVNQVAELFPVFL